MTTEPAPSSLRAGSSPSSDRETSRSRWLCRAPLARRGGTDLLDQRVQPGSAHYRSVAEEPVGISRGHGGVAEPSGNARLRAHRWRPLDPRLWSAGAVDSGRDFPLYRAQQYLGARPHAGFGSLGGDFACGDDARRHFSMVLHDRMGRNPWGEPSVGSVFRREPARHDRHDVCDGGRHPFRFWS